MQNVNRQLSATGKKLQGVGTSLSVGLTGPLALLGAVSLKAFDTQAKAIAQVDAGLKSTGNQVGKTSQQLQDMASELQNNSLFGDEEILKNATAQLLTFTNIAGDQFARTQQAALDLSTRLDGDLKSASIQLGKALNDPVANLSALSKSGIQFSAAQKETINALAKTNRLADAQTIILDELEKQYGGSAAAAAKAGTGPLKQLSNTLGDITEEFGAVIAEGIAPFVDWLKKLAQSFQQLDPATKKIIVVVGAFAAAIGPVVLIIGTFIRNLTVIIPLVKTFTAVLLANPIAAFAAAIAVIGGSLLVASTRFKALTNATEEFAKLNVVATDSIAKQKAELEKYLTVAKDDNLSKAEREKAIKKLNDLSPEYLGGLKLETINTDDATTATNKYINALLTKAKVQAAQEKLVSVQKQLLDLQLGQNDALKPSIWQVVKNQVTSFGNAHVAAAKNARSLVENFVEERTELGKLEDQLVSFINQNENLIQSLNKVPPLLPDNNPGDGRGQLDVVPTISAGLQQLPDTPLTGILQQLPKQREQINEELLNFQLSLLDFEQQSAGILEGAAESFAAGFGNIIAGIAQGANPIKGLVVLILNTIGDLLQQLGKAAISIGITMTGIKKAFTSPLGAIAAGVAAIALGAIIKTFIPKDFAGSFANGGVVGGNSFTGDKLFARINSGEMVLNQKQQANLSGMLAGSNAANPVLLDGSFVVTGDQLRLILDRSDKRKSRIG